MSILKSLQDYLAEFPHAQMVTQILTDIVDTDPVSFAVAPSGNSKIVEDIAGNRTYINNYVFYAREYTLEEADRADNYDFLDAFFEWIEDRNDKEIYPVLPAGYEVERISAANAILMDIQDDGRGVYQVQIQLQFTKGR